MMAAVAIRPTTLLRPYGFAAHLLRAIVRRSVEYTAGARYRVLALAARLAPGTGPRALKGYY